MSKAAIAGAVIVVLGVIGACSGNDSGSGSGGGSGEDSSSTQDTSTYSDSCSQWWDDHKYSNDGSIDPGENRGDFIARCEQGATDLQTDVTNYLNR